VITGSRWTVSPADLVPIPQISIRPSTASGKGRRSVPAAVLTSSPYKAALRESKAGKKCAKKCLKKATNRGDLNRMTKKNQKTSVTALASRIKKLPTTSRQTEPAKETDCECLTCGELYSKSRGSDQWIMCSACKMWAHEQCVNLNNAEDFVCDKCSEGASKPKRVRVELFTK
jgi:hypothetical protein